MKQSKTTLKELTAAYRAVLRHGILCNAIALGLIAAAPVCAETLTERRVISGGVVENLSGINASGIDASDKYGAVYFIDNLGGQVTIGGSEFSGNIADTSGAIEIREGLLTINNSEFNGNHAVTSSGAIETWTRDNVLSINNSTFSENYAPAFGAVSVFGKTGVNTISGSIFTGNRATATEEMGNDYDAGDGAAIFLGSEAKLKIIGTDFTGNIAGRDGGAISTRSEHQGQATSGLEIVNSTFTSNSAGQRGGAIYANMSHNTTLDGAASITGSTFALNNSVNGGAIYNDEKDLENNISTLSISGSTFTTNTATQKGGAIYNKGALTLNNAMFGGENVTDGNSATGSGGAIYTEGSLTLNGASFTNNSTTTGDGGAIKVNSTDTTAVTTITNSIFTGNTALNSGADGGAISLSKGILNINNSTFTGNKASEGGAIESWTMSNSPVVPNAINIMNSTFADNEAKAFGAVGVFGKNSFNTIENTVFTANHTNRTEALSASSMGGGAVGVGAVANLTISGTELGQAVFANNTSATEGGAIDTRHFSAGDNQAASMDIIGVQFTGNKAGVSYDSATGEIIASAYATENGKGGAINNNFYNSLTRDGSVYVADSEFGSNSAVKGGAIYNNRGSGTDVKVNGEYQVGNMYIVDSDFIGNTATTKGGAIYNEGILTGSNLAFNGNVADDAAVYNSGTLSLTSASFDNNTGGIYNNRASVTLTDTSFTNNVNEDYGAIANWGAESVLTINAENENVLFSGNVATEDGNAGDIYNTKGKIYLNAVDGKKIAMDGGITSDYGANKNNLYINSAVGNTGTVDIAGALKNHTVSVNAGELHLSNGQTNGLNLDGSVVNVASGATLNSIDNVVNNYAGKITLNDGALFGLDVDLNNNLYDTYSIADDATVTLAKINLLTALSGNVETKNLQIATHGNINIATAVKDSVKAYTSTEVFGLIGNDTNAGTVSLAKIDDVVSGTGLSLAVADSVNQEQSYYQVTADEAVTTNQDLVNEFAVVGAGTADGDAGVALDATLAVADDSTFTVDNAKVEGTGSIDTASNAEFAATNSKVGVDVNNAGNTTFTGTTFTAGNTFTNAIGATATMMNSAVYGAFVNAGIVYSDPTTYYDLFDNAGIATFEGDTFESTAVLNNTGTANLAKDADDNDVTFVSGAVITGDGLINLLSGTTHFNNTASSNIIKLASGAKFDGTLASTGAVDTRNGNIEGAGDLGTVTGGDLYVDANLGTGAVDTFAGTTGANVKGIKLANSGYGTSNKVLLAIGDATLDSDLDIEGTNYFTKIEKDLSGNIVFSDKLINESNLDIKLGSWTGGHYIKTNANMTTAADENHLTVGQALQALDTAVNGKQAAIVDSTTIAANESGGFDVVAGSIGATQLAGNSVASSNIIDGTIVNADIANGTIATNKLANQNVSQFANDAGYQNATQVGSAITTALANGGDAYQTASDIATTLANGGNAYQTASDVTTTLGAYSTTAQMNTAITNALANGGNAYQTASQVSATVGSAITTALANGGDAYQTASQVNTSITTALANGGDAYQTASQVTATVNGAINTALGDGGAVSSAIAVATTMSDDGNAGTTLYNNFAEGASVIDAVTGVDSVLGAFSDLNAGSNAMANRDTDGNVTGNANSIVNAMNNISATLGTIQGLNTARGEDAKGNLATGNTTVAHHLAALDDAIGDMRGFATNNHAKNTDNVAANLVALDSAIGTTTTGTHIVATNSVGSNLNALDSAIGATTTGTHVLATNSVGQNINALDTALNTAESNINANTAAIATLNDTENVAGSVRNIAKAYAEAGIQGAYAYTDKRIEKLDQDLSAGVASAVALSSVAVSDVRRGEVSVGAGYGYFNGQSAGAFGAAMGISNRWSVNAGAGVSGYDVSFRAGTNYKFKLF